MRERKCFLSKFTWKECAASNLKTRKEEKVWRAIIYPVKLPEEEDSNGIGRAQKYQIWLKPESVQNQES